MEQTLFRNHNYPENAWQSQEIAAPVRICIEDHWHKQKPYQEYKQERYQDPPDHTIKLRHMADFVQFKSVILPDLSVNGF